MKIKILNDEIPLKKIISLSKPIRLKTTVVPLPFPEGATEILVSADDGLILTSIPIASCAYWWFENNTLIGSDTPKPEPAPYVEPSVDSLKPQKISEINQICQDCIKNGFDIGEDHYSLQETDQINLTTAANAVQNGAVSFPYHSDGKLCRMYTAQEINNLVAAATKHKLYHTTLCNHLFRYIESIETREELDQVTYSEECLSDEFKDSFNTIMFMAKEL